MKVLNYMENCNTFVVSLDVDYCFDNENIFHAVLIVVLCNVSNENVNIFTVLLN